MKQALKEANTLMAPGVVTATTPRGQTVVLAADPDGLWVIVEQFQFLGSEPSVTAHCFTEADIPFLRPDVTRFALLG